MGRTIENQKHRYLSYRKNTPVPLGMYPGHPHNIFVSQVTTVILCEFHQFLTVGF